VSHLSKGKSEVYANLAEIFSWNMETLLLKLQYHMQNSKCSAENLPPERNPGPKHTRADTIFTIFSI
jgi:hypothetical protein